jgi:hypothetical protein
MEAIGQPLHTGMTLSALEGEDGWLEELLPFLTQVTSGASDVVDGVIEFTRDTDVEVSAATALRRLFNPSMSLSVSEEMTRYIRDMFSRSLRFSDADAFLERINEWAPANRRAYPVNLRDLQDFVNAIRSEDAIVSGNGVIALLLILAGGKLALSHPWEGNLLQKLGGSLGTAGDLWQGTRLLSDSAKYAEYAKLLNTPWGTVTSAFTGIAGLFQLGWNYARLRGDPTISDLRSNERWGVGLQALGAGFLMVGGAAGVLIGLGIGTGAILAALPILVPVGLVIAGVGWVVENWDWIGEWIGGGLAAWPGVFEMGGTIVEKKVVEPIIDGARAWSGLVDNGREIARALPSYVNEQVIKPTVERIDEAVIRPLASRLDAWGGIVENAGEIARAAPGYIREMVIEPAASAVRERVIEPVRNGLSAWRGVVDNGSKIIQAAPQYVNDRVVQPAIQTISHRVVEPAIRTINQRIVQPVQNTLSRAASAVKSIFGG